LNVKQFLAVNFCFIHQIDNIQYYCAAANQGRDLLESLEIAYYRNASASFDRFQRHRNIYCLNLAKFKCHIAHWEVIISQETIKPKRRLK